jgi:hypothetical protein
LDNAGRQLVDGNSWLGSRRGLPLPIKVRRVDNSGFLSCCTLPWLQGLGRRPLVLHKLTKSLPKERGGKPQFESLPMAARKMAWQQGAAGGLDSGFAGLGAARGRRWSGRFRVIASA